VSGLVHWNTLTAATCVARLRHLTAWEGLPWIFALILTRTGAMTAPVAVVNFMNYEGWEWGKIAAGGTMVMLPVLFFSILVRKFLVHGLTAGALKG
jgi:multiple sugar transport system permease protein